MNFERTYHEVVHDDGKLLTIKCDQLQRMAAYGISSIIQIPFPHYGSAGLLDAMDRDWLLLALKCRPEGPDLYSEHRKMVETLNVYMLQQRKEGANFYLIAKSVDGNLSIETTPEKVDLDFDQYPYQTEASIFTWPRTRELTHLKVGFPISWSEKLWLELDLNDLQRSEERLWLMRSATQDNVDTHRVAEELAGEALARPKNDELMLMELKPVYFTELTDADRREMATSTSNAQRGHNRFYYSITSSLRDLVSAKRWLIPETPYGGFTWKQVNDVDAAREGWIEQEAGVEVEV